MVSVIIVNYNTYELTKACISSVYKTHTEKTEIIIVDNASTEKDIDGLRSAFPELKIIKNNQNLGFAKANNIGINAATGNFILLLNSDAELKNDAISLCEKVLEAQPQTGVVSGQLVFPNGIIQHNCQSFPSIKNELIELFRVHKILGKEKASQMFRGSFFKHDTDCECDWVWGAFFMFRKADLQKLSGHKLSDRFFMYGEDMEWCYQFKLAGLKTRFAAEAKIVHHMGASSFGDSQKKLQAIITNELLFVKNYRGNLYAFIYRFIKSAKYFLLSAKNRNFAETGRIYRRL